MNVDLCREFTSKEVGIAVKDMYPTKAPGLDGMSTLFYQKYWHITGGSVTKTILNILNDNISPAALNKTYIALVPKVKNPQRMSEYRPISLCNVSYKILSKVLANRFKIVLPSIISEN